jgi:two-component system response regulator HydG
MMTKRNHTILVVDDDTAHRTMLKAHLGAEGYEVVEADDGDVAVHLVKVREIDLVLLDLKMQRVGGIEALQEIQEVNPALPVIILTAFSSVESAVEAMKKGAFDYLTKPVDAGELGLTVARAFDFDRLQRENATLRERLGERFDFGQIIALVAPSDATVLITGESGTGKELIANAVHQNSPRADGPFIKVNCAALHENLLESELFGHEKGAFTGAGERRQGRFELADKGTLFLDEIGDMSPTTQAKILRVLQEGEFERLGGTKTLKVDVRVVTASHKDLERMAGEGAFRQDLFFRLSVVPLHLPALRERPEDIPLLAEHFLRHYSDKNRKDIRSFRLEALEALIAFDWPGNIRELENAVERAVILCLDEQITLRELPPAVRQAAETAERPVVPRPGMTLKEMEKEMIIATLQKVDGNRTRAAQILGVSRQTLQNKLKDYDL